MSALGSEFSRIVIYGVLLDLLIATSVLKGIKIDHDICFKLKLLLLPLVHSHFSCVNPMVPFKV